MPGRCSPFKFPFDGNMFTERMISGKVDDRWMILVQKIIIHNNFNF